MIVPPAPLPTPAEEEGVLSVLMPAYNEAGTITNVLERVAALGPVLKEIVVVDDGSRDATAEEVTAFARQCALVRFFRLERNQGKTAAIRHALEQATGDVIIIQDADLEYDPAEIIDVIRPILDDDADVVYGSRFLVRKAARVLYFYHFLANKTLTFFSNVLTNRNMTDIETCYKAFRAEVIKPLTLTSSGFGMEIEITAMICQTKARTYETPISYYGRTYEEGKKIGLKDGVLALWYILYYNVTSRWSTAGRAYVNQVNQSLERRPREPGLKRAWPNARVSARH